MHKNESKSTLPHDRSASMWLDPEKSNKTVITKNPVLDYDRQNKLATTGGITPQYMIFRTGKLRADLVHLSPLSTGFKHTETIPKKQLTTIGIPQSLLFFSGPKQTCKNLYGIAHLPQNKCAFGFKTHMDALIQKTSMSFLPWNIQTSVALSNFFTSYFMSLSLSGRFLNIWFPHLFSICMNLVGKMASYTSTRRTLLHHNSFSPCFCL